MANNEVPEQDDLEPDELDDELDDGLDDELDDDLSDDASDEDEADDAEDDEDSEDEDDESEEDDSDDSDDSDEEDEDDELDDEELEELNEEADIAADYLEGLLDVLDYDGDIELGVRNGRPLVQIVADDDTDIKQLIGKDGEVVEALQRLARLAVQQKTGERSGLIVDVDGFLARKRRHLRNLALDAVDDVREDGEPVTLEDMNAYERKIIHDIVRQEGLKSRSHGDEPHRHVTVYLPKDQREALENEDADVDDVDTDEDYEADLD